MEWNWSEIDARKAERARSVRVFTMDKERRSMECVGSTGEIYTATLESCTCKDFSINRSACKHMVRLAMELGVLDEHGRNAEQQQVFDRTEAMARLAYWYGCYYLFDSPVVSNDEYDALKSRLANDFGVSFPAFSAPDPIPSDPISSVRIFLDSQNYEYIDKTAQGGSLYVFDEKAVNVIRAMGLDVSFAAEGTRSTKHRPAWYLKLDK